MCAANVSTVGKEQYLALIQEDPTVTIDTSTAGKTSIKFGKGSVTVSIGTAQILIEIGKIDFEVLDAPTPFLLCLADMDRLKVYFNNTTDELFTLKDNYHFNYEILVDVMYLRSKPTLHVFLNAILAKETWQALRMLWIDTYQGPPDILTHDAGTNFASAEFRAKAKIMGVTCKQVLTEAYWSIAVKAVNDIAGPNGLVPTLLVFGAYPLTDALNTCNGPDTADMLALPLQSEVLNKRKANVYITKKEEANLKLAIKLRNDRISDLEVYGRIYIFKSRLVREAQINLKRTILAHLPTKLVPRYLEGTLLHWTTYHRHHCKELDMSTLTYDLCLLVINSNADDFSMLGFILMLVNESIDGDNTFTICGNIIHYSLTKYKRVTRSVLASKIYGMIITERLGLPAVPLVICTDSYSLYECLINGEDNPADAFTKASPNRALERFVNSNKVTVRVEGWV
ncbi:hypothetical protein BU23DRAFT_585836 [Bimuria novae-zelandiae CBS 107.79]|uniref:Integrase catalytic domain-containing protein n=1 Tax=Bimuria novae-zelandiae CBS 107.79 TaxID=1447943 RepID=A0A6A5UGY4_9PLEO|nr:hypothetical protein BU23DRAFT_585836 [Bimuria novae-zelandiae CBS 107.79]